APGDSVLIVPSVPGLQWSPLRTLYGQAIATARERIWITNPYFLPGRVIRLALETAALRGVDVRLLLPSRSDHPLVSLASHSNYEGLLEAGVQIYEYERGFVHAKTLVIDEWVGTIGSANMDMRSFELNFELNAFVFGQEFCEQLASQFRRDLEDARQVTVEEVRQTGYGTRLKMAGARLLSPLM
ncbi:MAG: phospholipase D-like domain-containing protein, partial [Myxococcota bacterium]|nr:phospholipase D-like domain-containing protein [Myxococcota bacterium]